MMMRRLQVPCCIAIAFLAYSPQPNAAVVDDLLAHYRAQGAAAFDAAAAEAQWSRPSVDAASGETRRCSTCHTTNLKAMGKHATTGKAIEPLAPSVNRERLTDAEKIEKWLLRNCKWTLGRECTPQEKGNFLVMIRSK
jgi:hypothetical protein